MALSLSLGGSGQPAAAQFDLGFNPSIVSYQSSAVGPAASSKSITCNGDSGNLTCIIFGVNTDVMSNGVIATITFRIQPGTTAAAATIDLSDTLASTVSGDSLSVTASDGTIAINQPVNQIPTATNASITTTEDIAAQPILLAGIDPDGDTLSFSIVTQPTKGVLSGSGANRSYKPNLNANGADSFTFRVSDGRGGTHDGVISINITPVNDAPTAMNQAVSTPFNTNRQITLVGSDVDGDTLTFSITSGPSNGSVSGGTGPSRTYNPNDTFSGADSFTYQVSDGSLTATATVNITVEPSQNRAPTATDGSVTTNEDTPASITLSGNDPDGDPLTFTLLSQPSKGTMNGGGANWNYTPAANQNGGDSFNFQVSDGKGGTDSGTFSITITPVNDAPTAMNQSVSTPHNTARQITLVGNDVDGDTLTYSIISGPSNGTVSNGTGPNRLYTPNNGFSGSDSFTFRVSDGSLNAQGTVNINVDASDNTAPSATDGSVTTNEDTPAPITLTATDSDGDPITFTVLTQPTKGTLSGSGASRTYTPKLNENGADGFTFRASDGKGGVDDGTFTINITPVNDAPTTMNQSVSTAFNTAKPITLIASDVDGDTLTFTVNQPANGTLSGTGANRTYTPNNGYSGPDSFTYQVSDGNLSANGTVSITVGESQNQNTSPVATDGAVTTDEDTPVQITLQGTDSDGDTLSFTLLTPPVNGSLSGNGANWTFTPNPDEHGLDSLTFRVSDGNGGSDDGTVSITVTPVNDPPTTTNQSVSTTEGTAKPITLIGSDVDGDTLTFLVSQPAHGVLNSGTGPDHTYIPEEGYSGPDSFTYQVTDGTTTVEGMVTIMVAPSDTDPEPDPENNPPTATDDSVTTNEDTSKTITLKGSDPDGDALSFSVTSGPSHGALSGAAPNLTYTPNNGFVGDDAITFLVKDPDGLSDEGTVKIRVLESDSGSIHLTSLRCFGDSIEGGGSVTCSVSLNERAPKDGVKVHLWSSSDQLSIRDSAYIRSRRTSASFKVYASKIQVEETVQLFASLEQDGPNSARAPLSTELTLIPQGIKDISCRPVEVKAGKSAVCRVRLTSASYYGSESLSISSDTDDLRVPRKVSFRRGRSFVDFRAWARRSSKQQSATVTADMNGDQHSDTVSIISRGSPEIRVESPQVASAGKKLTIAVEASDPNDLPVDLSAKDLPPVAAFDPGSGRFEWTPLKEQTGTHAVTFEAVNSAEAASQKVVSIEVIEESLKVLAFTNSANSSAEAACSPGSLATLWGVGFTDGAGQSAAGFPLPTKLSNVRVTINGQDASLLYVGARQVNLQCPMLPTGQPLSITVEKLDTGEKHTWEAPDGAMRQASPAIYTLDGSGAGQGLVFNAQSFELATLASADFDGQAVEAGDTITLYANGLGAVDHAVAAGEPAAANPLSRVLASVSLKVGDVSIPASFAGLAPDLAGVYQVNAVLSDKVPIGPEVPVLLELRQPDGTVLQSNAVTIAIEQAPPPLNVAEPF